MIDYLKIGKASELSGKDKKLYRLFEILPGFLSWSTLILLIILSYLYPVIVAYFIIAFDVYWLLLVFYLGVHLLFSYFKMKEKQSINWKIECQKLSDKVGKPEFEKSLLHKYQLEDLIHLVILPIYNESKEIMQTTVEGIINDGYPCDKIIIVMTVEERGGEKVHKNALEMQELFNNKFKEFYITVHPDGREGEIKGKGSNQAWAAQEVKRDIIDKQNIDYGKILVSVFDIDTIVHPGYFYRLSYLFLTVENPYHASYQPIPIYNNNIWQSHFFARIAASSNTFWQMMQQIRQEKLATYSSHSMTWKALSDIGFWSTTMVSEDSRIFWHCFCYYNGDYRVEPMYFPVYMDICMDETRLKTAVNLYKQQRRWGWGVENVPYLIFNTLKRWKSIPKGKFISRIFVQIYGFHSWATNALIIAVVGWMPMLLGGDRFNSTVLSGNLPAVTRTLMMMAMGGLVLSAILSMYLLPQRPLNFSRINKLMMLLQWILLPITIVMFGAIPGLDSQTRLMFKKYMGFWVTPKTR